MLFFSNKHLSSEILDPVFVEFFDVSEDFLLSMTMKWQSTHDHCEQDDS